MIKSTYFNSSKFRGRKIEDSTITTIMFASSYETLFF